MNESTNCGWWDLMADLALSCRLGLNNPPTAVGGIFKLHHYSKFSGLDEKQEAELRLSR